MHKGKPSGKYAKKKTSPGRKGDYQRSGWPEDAPTQRAEVPRSKRQTRRDGALARGAARNRKAGGPRWNVHRIGR